MKKILFLIALFTLMGGVNSVKARTSIDMSTATASTNATWTSGTNTFAWTAENEYVVIPGLSGDLSGTYLDFTISAACHIDIVDTDDNVMNGGWGGYGRFGSGGSKTQDLEFMVSGSSCDITKVKEVRICSQSAEGSLTITDVSYYSPLKLNFDANGVATVPFKSIITSGGVTFDPATGVVTNTDGTGSLAIELPGGGIDLSTIKRLDVTYSGEDDIWGGDANRILKNLSISGLNTWSGSRYSCDLTDFSSLPAAKNVTSIVWNAGGKTGGSLTITSIKFTSEFISCAKAGETILKTLPWNKIDGSGTETPAWNMDGTSDTYYGNYSGDATHYADLTAYSELRVYCKSNSDGFRAFFIKSDKSGTNTVATSAATWNSTEKYYSVDLSKIEKWDGKVALKSIKSDPWSATSGQNVTNIVVYKEPAAGTAQYLLSGKGLQDAATTAMLADATVTSIDATGLTNSSAIELESANPNCLFFANSGKLSNSKNVIVSGTCANLELTDGYPFKAPEDFTATDASYTTTINTTAKAGTLCLPFEAAIPGGVTAYTLNYTTGNAAAKATEVTSTISANTPVLLNGSGSATFTGASVDIDADATNVYGALTGVFKTTIVPQGSYVLQNGADDLGFYKVESDDIEASPFRAYMTADGAGARSIEIDYEVTGISTVNQAKAAKTGKIYNLNGQIVSKPTKGLYIVDGKVVSF